MYLHELETLDHVSLRRLQSTRLSELVARLKAVDSEYWAGKMSGVGEVDSLDDLGSLPFTAKEEFRDAYPYGMLTVPMSDVVRLHASSGTSGKPTIVSYTRDDIAVFAAVSSTHLRAHETVLDLV